VTVIASDTITIARRSNQRVMTGSTLPRSPD
jgi:hypothetical protein